MQSASGSLAESRPAAQDFAGDAGMPQTGSSTPVGSQRIALIDNAKAIGIVLVVVGHASGIPPAATVLIYAMHMPLFFFLSGYLISGARLDMPMAAHCRKSARDLLLPYLVFFALSYAYWLLSLQWGGRADKFVGVSWFDPLLGFASGLGDRLIVNPALWFLPCLFTATMFHLALRKWIGARGALLAALYMGVLCMLLLPGADIRLPWGLDNGWVAMIFLAAGALLRDERMRLLPESRLIRLAALPLAALVFAALALRMGRVDLNMANFGPSPMLYLGSAASGIFLVLLLGSLLPASRLVNWLAASSLIIFATHPLSMNFATGVARLVFGASREYLDSTAWMVLSSLIGIGAAVPINWVLQRALPQVFARHSLQARAHPIRNPFYPLKPRKGASPWQKH